MQDALVVCGREARAELPSHVKRLVARQPADAFQQRRQVLAVDVGIRRLDNPGPPKPGAQIIPSSG
jgi:hypothetical protein